MKKEAKFEDLFIAASSSEHLSGALKSHLQETEQQLTRLQTIFEELALEPGGRECKGMQGLLSEGERLIVELESRRCSISL